MALGPDELLQAFGPVIGHRLHETGDGGQERVHVEGRVKKDHVCHQAGGRRYNEMKEIAAIKIKQTQSFKAQKRGLDIHTD